VPRRPKQNGSKRYTGCGLIPKTQRSRSSNVTECPRLTNSGASRLPMYPVAQAMNTVRDPAGF